ncbi:ras-domain-containing protein [Exidia glandulosa HHB12029]|uniref:Ras-domain-containing protein n=1 Tax=Exidia glandulosa HHB12029 TaxID=1314781 RepID=A0A165PV79_EXIGL|nr:ras-domain-containing protein [Exidia glandulosa HHB12029]
MRTIKLVIIGESGVGKTSLRTQYIAGRFSTGYRATIGADFFAKTLPHHAAADEQISLQIWDTAGQERFSSLSKAFFRGADAVLLVFDVNQPATLDSLRKWWTTFCEYAPVPDDETYKFCTVLVGNKTDLSGATRAAGKPVVSESDTQAFIDELIPPPPPPSPAPEPPDITPPTPPALLNGNGDGSPYMNGNGDAMNTLVEQPTRTSSIDILLSGNGNGNGNGTAYRSALGSRATSRSRFGAGGTINTVRTGMSIYHTPSSSFFDSYMSAPSSPPSPFGSPRPTHSRKRTSQSSLSSTVTVTPSRAHEDEGVDEPPDTAEPREPEMGPRLFFTSAKTGEQVSDVFAYVARRVVARWEWDETHIRDSLIFSEPGSDDDDTVRLGRSRVLQRPCC